MVAANIGKIRIKRYSSKGNPLPDGPNQTPSVGAASYRHRPVFTESISQETPKIKAKKTVKRKVFLYFFKKGKNFSQNKTVGKRKKMSRNLR